MRVNNAAFAIDCLPIPCSGIPNLDVICKACRLGELIFVKNMVKNPAGTFAMEMTGLPRQI
jgi:hypothetical protein